MFKQIRNLKLWQKLVLIGGLQLLPFGVATWLLTASNNREVNARIMEKYGLEVTEPVTDLLTQLGALDMAARRGDSAGAAAQRAALAEAGKQLQLLDATFDRLGQSLALGDDWQRFRADWNSRQAVLGSGDAAAVSAAIEDLQGGLWNIINEANNNSGLLLDPALDTYHLMNVVSVQIPQASIAAVRLQREALSSTAAGVDRSTLQLAIGVPLADLIRSSAEIQASMTEAGKANPALAGRYDAALKELTAQLALVREQTVGLMRSGQPGQEQYAALSAAVLAVMSGVHELHDPVCSDFGGLLVAKAAKLRETRNLTLAAILAALLCTTWLATVTVRRMSASVRRISHFARALGDGNFELEALPEGGDEFGVLGQEFNAMRGVMKTRVEADHKTASENLRVRQALDSASASVMMADDNGIIVYCNRATNKLMEEMEPEMRKVFPHFNARTLVGTNIDVFHKDPQRQRNVLKNQTGTHAIELSIAGRDLGLSAYVIKDDAGKRIGTAVEWVDKSAEKRAQREVEAVVRAAAAGELAHRVTTEGKQGFILEVSTHLNSLLDTNARVFGELKQALGALSRGDLTRKVEAEFSGEYAAVCEDVAATTGKLVEVVGQIQLTADIVNSGALQLARGNEDLSQRTTEQAASLEETAAAINELTATVKHNAENSSQANQLALSTRTLAEKGGAVVERAVTAMREINNSSKKIADIIGVIDDIAFQTNLLALNAAVEAARAGEQGRGFAVVATEVRNLARRSAESAKEIKTLIEDSVGKVEDGARLVDESGRTLVEIVAGVKKVTDLIGEISAASQEQSSGVEEINRAVSQMDQVTSQNAALVDEAATSTNALTEQVSALGTYVGFFNTGVPVKHTAQESKSTAAPTGERKSLQKAVNERQAARKQVASTVKAAGGGQEWASF